MKKSWKLASALVLLLVLVFMIHCIRFDIDRISMCRLIKNGTSENTVDFLLADLGYRKKILSWEVTNEQKNERLKTISSEDHDIAVAGIELFQELSDEKNNVLYQPKTKGFPVKVPYVIRFEDRKVERIYIVASPLIAANHECP